MASPRIVYQDEFHASLEEMLRFKESRAWRELQSWVQARYDTLASAYDAAADQTEVKCIQRERRVLHEMLGLPDLVIASLEANAALEAKKEDENVGTDAR